MQPHAVITAITTMRAVPLIALASHNSSSVQSVTSKTILCMFTCIYQR